MTPVGSRYDIVIPRSHKRRKKKVPRALLVRDDDIKANITTRREKRMYAISIKDFPSYTHSHI